MGVLVDETTRVLVQGITGREGSFHARACMAYGTNVVAGVTPGRGGTMFDDKVPVFNSVEEAVAQTQANMSLIFVPPAFAPDAIAESVDAAIPLIACITEGIPVQDMVKIYRYIENKPTRLIGPNCPGLITPGAKCKIGIMPGAIHLPGRVGVLSRSGTLTYEAVGQLTALNLGQSSCVGIGGDPIIGTNFVDILKLFDADPGTDAVVMIGEIGGTMEQDAAAFIKSGFSKPIAALVVGASAPPGKRMGHAGAIITGESATAEFKLAALKDAGAWIISTPADIGTTAQEMLKGKGLIS
ncbi:MAG: succinate--CoA ligase subunit alpha [Chloroflexi bacterium]|nr:succinate--CoA ligase subunit alpha [Chloroflexota bacterium]MQG55353.1 succinate--CoA ligase subunit alpha [SAR202 cluster bacterium]|tara:strand:+ start:1994 stop:2887 length:894 start_codon:yes stop_codon:yes gene_type:complete